MDKLQEVTITRPKPKTNTNKKGKWREIEQLRDKFQLERELKGFENSLEYMLDDL